MRPRTLPWLVAIAAVAVVAVVVGIAASGQGLPGRSPSGGPSSPGGSNTSAFPASPIEGVVIDVVRTSLTEVQGFTIRTADGRSFEFKVGHLDNPTQFPPGHLSEHQADGVPVEVTFHVEGTELIATHLADAG